MPRLVRRLSLTSVLPGVAVRVPGPGWRPLIVAAVGLVVAAVGLVVVAACSLGLVLLASSSLGAHP